MRLTRLFLVAVLAAALLDACARLLTGGPLVRDADGPTGRIVVVNGSTSAIGAVRISGCGADTYGLDRLPRGATLAPGESHAFTVSPGCWDVGGGPSASGGYHRVTVASGAAARLTLR